MLPKIARLKSELSRAGRSILVLGSVALFALPTWFAAAQAPEPKSESVKGLAVQKSESEPKEKAAADAAAVEPEQSPIEFFPELSEKERIIVRQLETPASFDFTDETLDGVRETIMERNGFDIVIEKNKLEEISIATDAADMTLQLHDVPLRSSLKLLLGRKGLAYVIEDDVLKITTEAAYSTELLTRIYPVSDLTSEGPEDFPLLMEAIRQGVKPGSWKESKFTAFGAGGSAPATPSAAVPQDKGGDKSLAIGTISMVRASGSLVVHHSWQGHDQVLKLLRALRKAKKVASPGE